MPSVDMTVGDLLNQLSSPDFFEREDAVKQLAQIKEDEAVAGLVMALEDEDRGIRELAGENLVRIGGDLSARLLTRFLGHMDISVRNMAAEILVKIGQDAIPALLEEFENPDHDIRKFVLDVLGLIKDKSTAGFIHKMLDDPNENVSCSAAEALGLIGSPESVEYLLDSFEKSECLRPQAAEALGRIGDRAAFNRLREYLTVDDPVVLYSVIEAIGYLRHPAGIKALSPFLDHEEQLISDAATGAIIRTAQDAGRANYNELPLDKFKKFLLDSLESDDSSVVQFALNELSHWEGLDIYANLINLLKRSDDDLVIQISNVLKLMGSKATDNLLDSLKAANDEERLKILDAIARIGNSGRVEDIVRLSESENPEIRVRVAYTLGKCGDCSVTEVLERLLEDSVGHVRAAAAKSLGWLGSDKDVELLSKCLNDQFPDVREAAMGAMILIGGEKVIACFTEDLNHSSPERQRLAAMALGLIGEEETRGPLKNALTHSDPGVRRSAIESLSRIGNAGDIELIKSSLSDENSLVRKAAVSGLVDLVGTNAVDDIKVLLSDDDMWVCYHTIDIIGRLNDGRWASLIAPYLDDDQDIIRIAAVKAMAAMGDRKYLDHLSAISVDGNEDLAQAVEDATKSLMGADNG